MYDITLNKKSYIRKEGLVAAWSDWAKKINKKGEIFWLLKHFAYSSDSARNPGNIAAVKALLSSCWILFKRGVTDELTKQQIPSSYVQRPNGSCPLQGAKAKQGFWTHWIPKNLGKRSWLSTLILRIWRHFESPTYFLIYSPSHTLTKMPINSTAYGTVNRTPILNQPNAWEE